MNSISVLHFDWASIPVVDWQDASLHHGSCISICVVSSVQICVPHQACFYSSISYLRKLVQWQCQTVICLIRLLWNNMYFTLKYLTYSLKSRSKVFFSQTEPCANGKSGAMQDTTVSLGGTKFFFSISHFLVILQLCVTSPAFLFCLAWDLTFPASWPYLSVQSLASQPFASQVIC